MQFSVFNVTWYVIQMDISGKRDLTDTPCVGICSATALGDEVCAGCGRTFQEVIEWNSYTDEQKIAINKRLLKSADKQ